MNKLLALVAVLVLLLSACAPPPPPAPTATPTPTPQDYLAAAANAMARLRSVQFSLEHEGAQIVLDPTLGAVFVSAVGAYESPDKVHATVKADLAGTVLEIKMLWLPEGNVISNPLTGAYQALPADIPLDPVAMFNLDTGISEILATGLVEAELVGAESIAGVEARHITANASAAAFADLVPVEVEGALAIDVWLAVDGDHVLRVEITAESGDTTTIEFFDFDEPVTIPSP